MPSSKNPSGVISVPKEILNLAAKRPEIKCNLRPHQRPLLKQTKEEVRLMAIKDGLFDTWFFYEPLEDFLKYIQPGERLILVCQGFGKDIFTLVTDVEKIYWADNHYPRIDFNKTFRVVKKFIGPNYVWGGFLLAVAKVGRVKKQARIGYDLLFKIARRPGGLKQAIQPEKRMGYVM